MVLEKTLESPLDSKEIKPVNPKRISSEYSLEGLMLEFKLQYFGHLMRRVDSSEKTDVGKDWRQKEKRVAEDEMVRQHHKLNGHELKLWKIVKGREAWRAVVRGVAKSWTQLRT